jgi:two-component sensor histidine kinase
MKMPAFFRPLRNDRPWWGIAAGATLFGLAGVVRWRFGGLTEGFGPMLLLPAILLAGLFGGIRVGVGAFVACFLTAWIWFFPPYGTFVLEERDAVTIAAFVLTATLELYVIRVLNLAINDLSAEKERSTTMFRELQHRVANNLQAIAGFLRYERKNLDQGSAGARAFETAQSRLDLMVNVHRSLNNPTIVDQAIGSYLKDMGSDLIRASNAPRVHLTVVAAPISLDLERLMPLSMIVTETVTNSLKYAFRDRHEGNLSIEFCVSGRDYILTVRDDGPGFAPTTNKTRNGSLGRSIVESLASQLRGKITFESGPGATVRLVFPVVGAP